MLLCSLVLPVMLLISRKNVIVQHNSASDIVDLTGSNVIVQ